MPQVVPFLVGAAKAGAAWYAKQGFITQLAVKTVGALALNYGVSKLAARKYDGIAQARGRTLNFRSSAQPRQLLYGQVRVGGQVVFASTSGTDNEFLWLAIVHAAHEVEELGDHWVDGEPVGFSGNAATGKYAGYLSAWDHLGSDTQTADANLTAAFPGTWTSAHRLRGCAYTVYRLKWDEEGKVFPGGIPTFTRTVKGKKVYDPRTSTPVWSANWALVVADYVKTVYGAANGDFESASWIAAANVCDEDVALNGGGYEKRYEAHGTIGMDEDPRGVLADLRDAGAGFVAELGGKWIVHAGAYRAPSLDLDEDDLVGAVSIGTRDSIYDGANRARGTFVSAADGWVVRELPPVTNATYLARDNGIERWADLSLRFTTSPAMGQRLEKIVVERAAQGISVSCLATTKALTARPGDVATLSSARFGWVEKEFTIERLKPVLVGGGADTPPAVAVELELRETAAGVWDWADGEETVVDLAPNTDLPDPWTVGAAAWGTLESGTAHLVAKGDGSILSRIWAPWSFSGDAFVALWELEYATSAAAALGNWIPLPSLPAGARGVYVPEVSDGVEYRVRIRAVNALGIKGAWVESGDHTVVGKSAAPSAVTGLAAVALERALRFSWNAISDLDVAGYRVHVGLLSGAPPPTPTALVDGTSFVATGLLPGTTYYCWVYAVDSSGNVSPSAGPASAVALWPAVNWSDVDDDGDRPEDGATVGADWGSNLDNIPDRFGEAPGAAGLYVTDDYLGYYNGSGWGVFIASDGLFHFGDGDSYLDWDGTLLELVGAFRADASSGIVVEVNDMGFEAYSAFGRMLYQTTGYELRVELGNPSTPGPAAFVHPYGMGHENASGDIESIFSPAGVTCYAAGVTRNQVFMGSNNLIQLNFFNAASGALVDSVNVYGSLSGDGRLALPSGLRLDAPAENANHRLGANQFFTNPSNGNSAIEIGGARTGDRAAILDMHAASNGDYEARLIRNSGANGKLQLRNRGAGDFELILGDGGTPTTVVFKTDGIYVGGVKKVDYS